MPLLGPALLGPFEEEVEDGDEDEGEDRRTDQAADDDDRQRLGDEDSPPVSPRAIGTSAKIVAAAVMRIGR